MAAMLPAVEQSPVVRQFLNTCPDLPYLPPLQAEEFFRSAASSGQRSAAQQQDELMARLGKQQLARPVQAGRAEGSITVVVKPPDVAAEPLLEGRVVLALHFRWVVGWGTSVGSLSVCM
jgi:hypothetical protein